MKSEIRHRRLNAFFKSKVLNSLMILIVESLLLMRYFDSILIPGICCGICLLCFIGYSLWLWIKKPESIVINDWLSNITGYFTLYFLIILAINNPGVWWYIFPSAVAVIIFFVTLVTKHDENYDI